ncbi:hypothetical protein GCM10011519_31450 [Marmoricola endophyticus]|uniref:ABC-2 type transporter transmembrane domain-containing protein n=1 Tax=Marmoricola endophyticus TaxID=2040280 RepID=A0A917BQJ1_9ACTN|nr:ABC transporter permease [Marmoricola endophyticus]GGF55263.1 hypothetical protein GCM10011519_31450 [Marmoricola endophyticus]
MTSTQHRAASGPAVTPRTDHGPHSHAEPRPTPWGRYRRWYSRLPPALQMIGLQMWLPLVFVVAFCLCYVYAFHSPAPKDLPVAVVGQPAAVGQLATGLESNSKGVLDVSTVVTASQARDAVASGDLVAAYAPAAGQGQKATLLVASGAQYQLEAVAAATFQPVAAAQGAELDVQDLAPLPSQDSYGTSLFYLVLVWTIGGYMVAMFVGMMGAALSHRTRAAIIVGSGLVTALLSSLLVDVVVGAVTGHFWAMLGVGWATTVAIGAVVNGLAYFFGRFVTGVALLIFVFLNIPSSTGAFPPELVPEPFAWLHHVSSAAGVLDVMRDIVYDVGPGAGTGFLVLLGYLVVGLVLSAVGKPYHEARQARRKAAGKPPTMMQAAQGAMAAAAAAAHEEDDSKEREDEVESGSGVGAASAVVAGD